MLKNYYVKGYKTFKDGVSFSMEPNNRIKKNIENVIQYKNRNLLKSAIIYGPNNTGKSALIESMSLLIDFIKKGKIDNAFFNSSSLYNFFCNKETMEFDIELLIDKDIYRYELFLDKDNQSFNDNLFINDNCLLSKDIKKIHSKYVRKMKTYYDIAGLSEDKLCLESVHIDYLEVVNKFKESINNIIIINDSLPALDNTINLLKDGNTNELFNSLIRSADLSIEQMSYDKELNADKVVTVHSNNDDTSFNELLKLKAVHTSGTTKVAYPSVLFDSFGTKKMVILASYIIDALKNNKVIIVDELDGGWHTLLTRAIFTLFNSEENKHAQLISTVHDIYLLDDVYLFRKDQIWFTQKSNEGNFLYSLNDYKANDNNVDYRGEKALEKYLKGIFGALPNPDFSSIMKDLLKDNF